MYEATAQLELATAADASPRRMPWAIALFVAMSVVGIYHDPSDVGLEIYDFSITTELLAQQDETDGQVQVGTPQKKIAFAALALIGFYLAFIRTPVGPYRANGIAWLAVACIGWAMCSYLWSVEPPVTLRELIRLSVVAMTAYGIARCFDANQMMFIVMVVGATSVFTALGSEAMGGYLRPWQSEYRLQGGMHANMVAVHAAMMALAGLGLLHLDRHRTLLWTMITIALVSLWITKSRSAAGVFLIAAFVQWSLKFDPRKSAGYWAGIVTAVALALMVWAVGGSQLQRAIGGAAAMGRTEDVGSLTGRLPLWHAVTNDISRSPIFGYGYEAFWTAERRIEIGHEVNWYPTDAHSVYVNTTLELGFVGIALGITLVWWAAMRLVATYRQTSIPGYAFFAALLVFAMVHGLTEAGCSAARVAGLCLGAGVFLAGRLTAEEPAVEASGVSHIEATGAGVYPYRRGQLQRV